MTDEAEPRNAFLERSEDFFRRAVAADLPIFLTSETESSPLNATPYYARYALFRETVRAWPGREKLVSELDSLIERAERLNLSIQAILLGGSFTELHKTTIGDLDCLLLYQLRDPGETTGLAQLKELQHDSKERGVDARFVPLDGDPLALIKMISYFTFLYSKRIGDNEIVRCLLLLDCRP